MLGPFFFFFINLSTFLTFIFAVYGLSEAGVMTMPNNTQNKLESCGILTPGVEMKAS